jgi:hypothetical protein
LRLRLAPMTLVYSGNARFAEVDLEEQSATTEAHTK